jgi:hypothetical protein
MNANQPVAPDSPVKEGTNGNLTDPDVHDKEMLDFEKARKNSKRIYPVSGYSDHENMWEKLINVEKVEKCPNSNPNISNNKHKYNICVQDRIFKIKKNPLYKEKKKRQDDGVNEYDR